MSNGIIPERAIELAKLSSSIGSGSLGPFGPSGRLGLGPRGVECRWWVFDDKGLTLVVGNIDWWEAVASEKSVVNTGLRALLARHYHSA